MDAGRTSPAGGVDAEGQPGRHSQESSATRGPDEGKDVSAGRAGCLERRPAGRAQGKTQVAHLHLLVSLMCKEGKRLIWSNPRLTGHHWLLSFLALNIDLRATLQSE